MFYVPNLRLDNMLKSCSGLNKQRQQLDKTAMLCLQLLLDME